METSLSALRKQAESEGTISGGTAPLLPAGTYSAKVIQSTAAVSAGGKTQFKLRFEVTGGPETGKKVWETLTVSPESPKALGIVFGAIDILGGTAAVERDASAEEVAAAMLGATASIVTYTEEYNNVERAKVRYINRIEGSSVKAAVNSIPNLNTVSAHQSGVPF